MFIDACLMVIIIKAYNFLFCPSQEAERAIQCLNGKLALSKKLVVRWAHAQVKVSVTSQVSKIAITIAHTIA